MPFPRRGAIGTLIQFTYGYGTGVLLFAGNGFEPLDIPRMWAQAQEFGNRVGIEEKSQSEFSPVT